MSSSSSILSSLSSDDIFAVVISTVALLGTAVSIIADTYKIEETRITLQHELNKENTVIAKDTSIINNDTNIIKQDENKKA